MDSLKNIKILYIEDEEFIRKNGIEYLGFYSDFVYDAKDGIEGFSQYQNIKPDIIICDIMMPKLNGLELIKKIRSTDKSTKIIVATARVDTEFLLKAVELGLVKYIVKPITEKKLLDALSSAIELMGEDGLNIIELPSSIKYDKLNKILFHKEKEIKLTKKEHLFIELCIKNKDRITTYNELESYVWDGYMTEDGLRSMVKALRKKLILGDTLINTSGVGYKLNII